MLRTALNMAGGAVIIMVTVAAVITLGVAGRVLIRLTPTRPDLETTQ